MITLLLICLIQDNPPAYIDTIEFNHIVSNSVRTCIIFRDFDKRIVDWRWDEQQTIYKTSTGLYMYVMMWEESIWDKTGTKRHFRIVYIKNIIHSFTDYDVEFKDRDRFPEHKRRKLFP